MVEPLHHQFIRNCRRHPFRFFIGDARKPHLSFFKGLVASVVLARALKSRLQGEERVGILLPASVGGVLANLAMTLSGRIVVNLNFTLGERAVIRSAEIAKTKFVISSREFLAAIEFKKIDSTLEFIFLEDLIQTIDGKSRFLAFLACLSPRVSWIEKFCGGVLRTSMVDVVTIIFSSGSSGDPKGVLLTHENIRSNLQAIQMAFQTRSDDKFLGVLPLFHSFGFAVLWFAACQGRGMAMHPNPLDTKSVGEIVERYRVSILLATPTFLQLYMRRCSPQQFRSLRLVITGAEKLTKALEDSFDDQFGVRPLSAYGATECSPGISTNTNSEKKSGTVGKPFFNVTVKIVHPETGEPLGPNEEGMILVRGPNVMKGYLDQPQITRDALRSGWYRTGDIGFLDSQGFLTITDRASRFSKIAGEMVPHGKVEEALHEVAGVVERTFIVTGVRDELKGEALAVVHTFSEDQISNVLQKLPEVIPNLFIPRRERFYRVDTLPVLGSGKVDLQAAKLIVNDQMVYRRHNELLAGDRL